MNFHEITIHIWPKTNEPANYTQKTHSCANISLYGLVILILMGCCSELPISSNAENITAEPQGSSANPFMSEKQARSVAFEFSESVEGSSLCNAQLKRSYILSTHPTADFHPITFPTAEVLQALEPGVFHHTPITSEYLDTMWFVVPYQNDETSSPSYWAHAFTNPRYMNVGHSETSVVDRASYMLYLPIAATKIMLYCSSQMEGIAFDLTADVHMCPHVEYPSHCSGCKSEGKLRIEKDHRTFFAQQNSIKISALQSAGPPELLFNIVFVSSGYTAVQEHKFVSDCMKMIKLLENPSQLKSQGAPILLKESVPWIRYMSFMNIFTVFEPSAQEGASITGEKKVDNNLMCSFPRNPTLTGVRCDVHLAFALAQATPAQAEVNRVRSLVIALVNHDRYGGTGLFLNDLHFASISNFFLAYDLKSLEAIRLTSLVAHELGHAIANLMDEYDIGQAGFKRIEVSNCSSTSDITKAPWAHWYQENLKAKVTASLNTLRPHVPYDMSAAPIPICGFRNYYRPNEDCLMRDLDTLHLCPVCREAGSIMMLNTIGISFLWPQCPLKDQLVMIPQTSTEIQHVFVNIALERTNDFMVTWSVDHPQIMLENCSLDLMANTCRKIRPKDEGYPFTGAFTITVRIVHDTTWIVKDVPNASWTQATTFSFFVYNEATAPLVPNYTKLVYTDSCKAKALILDYSKSQQDLKYLYRCATHEDAVCELKFTAPEYHRHDTAAKATKLSFYIFFIVVVLTIVLCFVGLYSAYRFYIAGKHKVRPIFHTSYRKPIQYMTILMSTFSLCLIFSVIVIIIIALVSYATRGPFGKVVLGVESMIALCTFILGLVGFWAVQNRGHKLILVNIGLLTLGLIASIIATVTLFIFANHLHSEVEDPTVLHQELHQIWANLVQKHSDFVCDAQLYVQCTGWTHTCDSPRAIAADCPYCPEAVGRPWYPCQFEIINYVLSQGKAVLYLLIILGCGFITGIVLNVVLLVELYRMKRLIEKNNKIRVGDTRDHPPHTAALRLLISLNKADAAALRDEFRKIDADMDGHVTYHEMAMFFKKSLRYLPSEKELRTVFLHIDADQSGTVSASEFIHFLEHAYETNLLPIEISDQSPLLTAHELELLGF